MKRTVSRRTFLGGAVLGATGVGLVASGDAAEAFRTAEGAVAIHEAWDAASQSNEAFLAQKGPVFKNVALGCSFAPEEWSGSQSAGRSALDALRYAVEDLGLRHVRLGLRWDRVSPQGVAVDLAYYRPYLDYLFAGGLNVSLNVGPIRVFRWPEDHVPAAVLARVSIPNRRSEIDADSALAGEAYAYLARLLDALEREYGDKIGALASIQPENEAFWPFGTHEWTMSPAYLQRIVGHLHQRLPDVPILLTSAGRLNLRAVTRFFDRLVQADASFRGRLVSGFDYHYKTPWLQRYPIIRHLDPIAFALCFPPAPTCDANIRDARRLGYAIEVSEGEAEPTGKITSPGNSDRDFRFMLLRCSENVLDPNRPSVLRIWGIERLARLALTGEATEQHQAIFDLVRRLNDIPASRPVVP